MLRSFLTITLRVLWRNKITSLVNIFSLGTGIACFVLIMLYVNHETSYDKFNHNFENIYRLEGDEYAKLPPVVGPYVLDRVPEVKSIARLSYGFSREIIAHKPERDPENIKTTTAMLWLADSSVFDVFTAEFVKGKAASALELPMTVVLSERIAKNLFGNVDPLGKSIEWADLDFTVTGVIKDISKSHIQLEALLSFASMETINPTRDLNNTARNSWLWSATYLVTSNSVDDLTVTSKINDVLREINDGNLFDTKFHHFDLRPLKEIYFDGAKQNLDYGLHGSFKLISILFSIGVFMLVLACINYVNLTTARSSARNKEFAVKRVVGSSINLVRLHLLLESTLVAIISLIAALTFTQIFISKFNEVANVNIRLAELNYPHVWTVVLAGALLLGVVAGIYPAFFLTKEKPIELLKGRPLAAGNNFSPRSILMTFQFSLLIVLIVCALAVLGQLDYIRHADLGFTKDQLLQVATPSDIPQEYEMREVYRTELLQHHAINGVAYSAGGPAGQRGRMPIDIEGTSHTIDFIPIDHQYLEVMEIPIVAGQGFTPKKLEDYPKVAPDKIFMLVNEAFVRDFGITSPIGRRFSRSKVGEIRTMEIIGIVKDFHLRSLHHKISPLIMINPPPMHLANIKISAVNLPSTIMVIEKAWKKVYGDRPFSFSFLNEEFQRQYENDEQLATIISWFTGLSLIIACLGLFALASFVITRRTKEIGIRKTMGASTKSIYVMLSWDFLRWIVLAVVLACPVSWFIIQQWLNKFAYHINLTPGIFFIAALAAILISILTITSQSLKAARSNPIDSLKYE
jgi:putative ABC transport system permease protein